MFTPFFLNPPSKYSTSYFCPFKQDTHLKYSLEYIRTQVPTPFTPVEVLLLTSYFPDANNVSNINLTFASLSIGIPLPLSMTVII